MAPVQDQLPGGPPRQERRIGEVGQHGTIAVERPGEREMRMERARLRREARADALGLDLSRQPFELGRSQEQSEPYDARPASSAERAGPPKLELERLRRHGGN